MQNRYGTVSTPNGNSRGLTIRSRRMTAFNVHADMVEAGGNATAGLAARRRLQQDAAATALAEAGATAHQLMAWFGWKSLKDAERYTRAVNQKKLAASVVTLINAKG